MNEAKIDLAKKKQEAIKRMRSMKMLPTAIRMFREQGTVMATEGPLGAFYNLNEQELAAVQKFEQKCNALVYSAIRNKMPWGRCLSMFFVSDWVEDWTQDREDLEDGQALVWVQNFDEPANSEMGTIGYAMGAGAGPVRVW